MRQRSIFQLALLLATSSTFAFDAIGCYNLDSGAAAKSLGEYTESTFQSVGQCASTCGDSEKMALMNEKCWCFDGEVKGTKLDDIKCNLPCPGYPVENCGGIKVHEFYSIYSNNNGKNESDSSDSVASTLTATKTATITTTASASSAAATNTSLNNPLLTDDVSKKWAGQIASNIIKNYLKEPDLIPGLLPTEKGYHFGIDGLLWNTMVNYWKTTGDDQFVAVTQEAIKHNVGPDLNFQPPNQTLSLGNDDVATWGLVAMSAAEVDFPAASKEFEWLELAVNVANVIHGRWDIDSCDGGLRWQIFASNKGYDYKNSISNILFLQLSARLFAHTGNNTYKDWANDTQDWLTSTGLIASDSSVYDSVHIPECKVGSKIGSKLEWTYNTGALLHSYAYLYNATSDSVWKDRLTKLWTATEKKFFVKSDRPVVEPACEKNGACNTDQITFKSWLAAGMGAAVRLAPFYAEKIEPKLRSSAMMAGQNCEFGREEGKMFPCTQFYNEADSSGYSEQISALNFIIAPLSSEGTNSSNSSSSKKGSDGRNETAADGEDSGAASRAGVTGMATALVLGVMAWTL